MSTPPVTFAAPAPTGSIYGQAAASAGQNALTQSDFLSLLTTQLQNQDPTNPVDDNQIVSQLAQLSMVQNLGSLNTTVTGIASQLSTIGADLAPASVAPAPASADPAQQTA